MKTYFKYGSILACFIIAFFLFRGCGKGGGEKIVYRDTVSVRVDTFYKEINADSDYILYPYKIVEHDTLTNTDTLWGMTYKDVDTAAILHEFFNEKYYYDSMDVMYGKVYVRDTVSQNKIQGRGVSTRLNIPTITKTITLTAPRRATLFLGTDINGNKEFPLYSIGVNAGLMFNNQKYWGVQYSLTRDGAGLYGLRFMLPIRTKK